MHRLTCQLGLPRSGLYAVADWYLAGSGENADHRIAGHLDDLSTEGPEARFVTIETALMERVQGALARCDELEATCWIQLRDPYNWFASLSRGVATWAVNWRYPLDLEPWKDLARLCVDGQFWLSYNRWFTEVDYRRSLADRFEFRLHRDGEPWMNVPTRGQGSSFDGDRYRGNAQQMAVLERFRAFVDDPDWRNCFDDEVVDLGERLFGLDRPW